MAQEITQQQYDDYSKTLGNILIDTVTNNLVDRSGGTSSPEVIQMTSRLNGLRGQDYFAVYQAGLKIVQENPDLRGPWNKGLSTIGPKYLNMLVNYRTQLQQAQQQSPVVAPTTQPGVATNGPQPSTKKIRLLKMQNRLRGVLGLKPVKQNPYDAEFKRDIKRWGPRTWNYWKKTRGAKIKDLIDMLEKEMGWTDSPGTAKRGPGQTREQQSSQQYNEALSSVSAQVADRAYGNLVYILPEFRTTRLSIGARRAVRKRLQDLAKVNLRRSYPASAYLGEGRNLEVGNREQDAILEKMNEQIPRLFNDKYIKQLEGMK